MTEGPDNGFRKHQELMLRIARRPGFCCCCICLPREDRRRARRVFRLTRRVMRAWDKDRETALKREAESVPQDRP